MRIGRVISIDNGPTRDVEVRIARDVLSSEISEPAGPIRAVDVTAIDVVADYVDAKRVWHLFLQVRNEPRIRFYTAETLSDIVLLLDELKASLGNKPITGGLGPAIQIGELWTLTLVGFTGDAQTPASLSATSPEAQSALKIIDGVMASRGFAPTADTDVKVADSLVKYTSFTAEGRAIRQPSISVRLTVDTLEFDILNCTGLSLEDKQLIEAVTTELRSHYGAERVKQGRSVRP